MFDNAGAFNADLPWDTSQVTDMSYMFHAALAFGGDVTSWDVGSCNNFAFMFNNAVEFNRDLCLWNVDSTDGQNHMFTGSSGSYTETCQPSSAPSNNPTMTPTAPSEAPSNNPTMTPTAPSEAPTSPSGSPTAPSEAPTSPSGSPTAPSSSPTTSEPSEAPSTSNDPSEVPSFRPTTIAHCVGEWEIGTCKGNGDCSQTDIFKIETEVIGDGTSCTHEHEETRTFHCTGGECITNSPTNSPTSVPTTSSPTDEPASPSEAPSSSPTEGIPCVGDWIKGACTVDCEQTDLFHQSTTVVGNGEVCLHPHATERTYYCGK